jgi:uncharacterized coiled-coil protein SlyX
MGVRIKIMMKSNRRVILLVLLLVLANASQSHLFAQDYKSLRKKVSDFRAEIEKSLKNEKSPAKKGDIGQIQMDLKTLESRLQPLKEEDPNNTEEKSELHRLDNELTNLTNRFNSVMEAVTISDEKGGDGGNTTTTTKVPDDRRLTEFENRLKTIEKNLGIGSEELGIFDKLIKWAEYALVILIPLGGLGATIYFLRRTKQQERSEVARRFSDLGSKSGRLDQKIKELTDVTTKLSEQVAQQTGELRNLKQSAIRQGSAPPPPPSFTNQPQRERPKFPISVDDYLSKNRSGSTAVKYDYKEKMFVQDGESDAGLTVVRDSEDGKLYLVPSFGFFQTKSDFTNYFERYYTCLKPMGGSVVIRQPATVNPVAGGWQLVQTGELEVT